MGPRDCPETSYLTANLRCVTLKKSEDLIYKATEAWYHAWRMNNTNYFMPFSHKVKLRDVTQKHSERPAAVSTDIFHV